jgi:hypothetical protein
MDGIASPASGTMGYSLIGNRLFLGHTGAAGNQTAYSRFELSVPQDAVKVTTLTVVTRRTGAVDLAYCRLYVNNVLDSNFTTTTSVLPGAAATNTTYNFTLGTNAHAGDYLLLEFYDQVDSGEIFYVTTAYITYLFRLNT